MIGVLYVLLWEGSIATFAASASELSIAAYGRALVAERFPERPPPWSGPAAAVVILAAAAAFGVLAARGRWCAPSSEPLDHQPSRVARAVQRHPRTRAIGIAQVGEQDPRA